MPGSLSALERHEWTKHGSCYSADPAIYYNDALSLVQQVDSSATGDYLRSNVGRRISITKLRRIFAKEFGRGSGSRVAMECRRGILSEIRISLKSGGGDIRKLLAGAAPLRSKCGEAIVDAPGLYRKRSR
jgi:ribonuclease T2